MERLYTSRTVNRALGLNYNFSQAWSKGYLSARKEHGKLRMTTKQVSVWLARTGRIRQVDIWILDRFLNFAADAEATREGKGGPQEPSKIS